MAALSIPLAHNEEPTRAQASAVDPLILAVVKGCVRIKNETSLRFTPIDATAFDGSYVYHTGLDARSWTRIGPFGSAGGLSFADPASVDQLGSFGIAFSVSDQRVAIQVYKDGTEPREAEFKALLASASAASASASASTGKFDHDYYEVRPPSCKV